MELLVLGGTGWLGGHVATTAVRCGHDVTCLARSSHVPDGARLVRADRNAEDALMPAAASEWDAVIDVATEPGHVRRAVRELEPVARHYTLVSTGNVYASQADIGADETAERMHPLAAAKMVEPDDYGPAKVACEDAVVSGFGANRSLIARAGLIGGPGDPTGRTDYWPWRFAHPATPGEVLVPDAPDLPTAIIDVRDLASWLVRSAVNHPSGAFDAMGRPVPFPDHIRAARVAAGSSAAPVAAPERWLRDHEVHEWSGPRSMPLWLADTSWYGMNSRAITSAVAAGLALRPLADTLRDGLEWRASLPDADRRGAGLTDDEERALLRRLADDQIAGS